MFTKKYSLRRSLFVLSGLLIASTTMLITWYHYKQSSAMLMKEFDNRAEIIAKTFAYQSYDGIIVQDPYMFSQICRGILKEKNLKYAMVYDKKGAMIYEQFKPGFNELAYPHSKELSSVKDLHKTVNKHVIRFENNSQIDHLLDIRYAVRDKDEPKKIVGYVRIGLSLSEIKNLKKRLIFNSFFISLIILGVGLITTFRLSKTFTKSLRVVVDAMRNIITSHDLSERIEQKSKIIEFDEIQTYFNKMTENLSQTTASLDLLAKEIVEREQAEHSLRESEERFRTLAENAPFGMSIMGSDDRYEYINPKFTEILGYSLEDIPTGKVWIELAYPDPEYRKEVISTWLHDLKTYKRGESRPREFKVTCKDGSQKNIYFRSVMLKNGNQVVTYEDMTETRKLEAQLRQATKMEAVGILAGGIAHDFNNILQAISGFTQLLIIDKREDQQEYHYLKQIELSVNRASELTRQLLTFSRKVESKRRPIDLNHEIRGIEKLLRRTIPKMINMELNLSENLSAINADPGQMEQVMINISLNAKDAMPEGGRLIFETENVILDQAYTNTHLGAIPGQYALLTISDTGHGMDKDTLEHIFEPFYTTKEMGKGTGLGLAMVYGIIKNHQGYIMCYSELGRGTTFKIYLPALKAECCVENREEIENEDISAGNEAILLVDDEEPIRDLGREILEKYGYEVIVSPSGEDAIEKIEEKKIDLVILDLGMPGMGGIRCLKELTNIDPAIKIIIASGYLADIPNQKNLQLAKAFIGKPYHLKGMLKKVREVLDRN